MASAAARRCRQTAKDTATIRATPLNMSYSGGDELGAWMTSHSAVAKTSFTGSVPTAKAVAVAAAPDLKRFTLELGGNDAAIVLADADALARGGTAAAGGHPMEREGYFFAPTILTGVAGGDVPAVWRDEVERHGG